MWRYSVKLLSTVFYCRAEARHASDWKNETEGAWDPQTGAKKEPHERGGGGGGGRGGGKEDNEKKVLLVQIYKTGVSNL